MTDSDDSDVPTDGDQEADEVSDGGSTERAERTGFVRTLEPLHVDVRVLPYVPRPSLILGTLTAVVWVTVAYELLRDGSGLLLDYWFMKSVGLESVYWTNLSTGTVLFVVAGVAFAAAVYLPLRAYAVTPSLRRFGTHVAAWTGILGGWMLASHYQEYLLAFSGGSFGTTDPYFGHDVGFYAFVLPALWTTLLAVTALAAVGLVAALVGQADRLRSERRLWEQNTGIGERAGLLATPAVQGFAGLLGVVLAADVFLGRYEVLWKNNLESGIPQGAEAIDVGPFFSTVNAFLMTALVILGITALAVYLLRRMHAHYSTERARERDDVAMANGDGQPDSGSDGADDEPESRSRDWSAGFRRTITVAIVALVVLDLAFFSGVVATDNFFVQPNQPPNQNQYIDNHMNATLDAYQLSGNSVDVVDWEQPNPYDTETLLESDTVQRAPILPGWVSHLESPVDLPHVERLRKTGSTEIYGPVKEVYTQEQQLRPYYGFSSIDSVRYTIDGEKRMFTSAARELPTMKMVAISDQPLTWPMLHFLYTHGYGLVMSPADEVTPNGNVKYAVEGIPPRAKYPELESEPRLYYGEVYGGVPPTYVPDDYVFTNARDIPEYDYVTPQQRQVSDYPKNAGIPMDGYLKRLAVGLTMENWDVLFSDLIDHDSTQVHYHRDPVERVSRIAPFLFVDCNSYAVAADGRTQWMVNALTTTKRYPNSLRKPLGDKAEERCAGVGQTGGEQRTANYAEDSVKVTVDAMTGDVTFYKWTDAPVVDAWANVYPDLFTSRSEMSDSIRSHVQYPLQWFHIQTDDIYKRYHQSQPTDFFMNEDVWDDADEVRGPIMGNRDEIVFSSEPMDLLVDPADLPNGSELGSDDMQFTRVMAFTPEGARNLRSMMFVTQDPDNYGRIVSLRVPQGTFMHGPEQADAIIDQNETISQQIELWNRMGSEVVRGHTLMLPVKGDLLYLEPIWARSQQNAQPEIRRFVAVYHGEVGFAKTPEGAIRSVGARFPENATASATGNATTANATAPLLAGAAAAPGGDSR